MWYTVSAMRPIATNTNDFETLRTLGQIDVDKTRGLPIYAFGLSFDSETRQFVEGKVEKII